MASHVHGPRYVRPDDRGRCTHVEHLFGQLVQCDSANFAGSLLCAVHFLADHFGITEAEAALALAAYYEAKAAG